jgi:hypothetical protein
MDTVSGVYQPSAGILSSPAACVKAPQRRRGDCRFLGGLELIPLCWFLQRGGRCRPCSHRTSSSTCAPWPPPGHPLPRTCRRSSPSWPRHWRHRRCQPGPASTRPCCARRPQRAHCGCTMTRTTICCLRQAPLTCALTLTFTQERALWMHYDTHDNLLSQAEATVRCAGPADAGAVSTSSFRCRMIV